MKNILLLMAACICLLTTSCSKQADNSPPVQAIHHSTAKVATEHTISKMLADSLIGSFRTSISGDLNAVVQALDVTESVTMIGYDSITTVRAYLAHKVDWATNHYGQLANYENDKLTLVIVGFDKDGYAVAFEEYFSPCPGPQCQYNVQLNTDKTFAVRPS